MEQEAFNGHMATNAGHKKGFPLVPGYIGKGRPVTDDPNCARSQTDFSVCAEKAHVQKRRTTQSSNIEALQLPQHNSRNSSIKFV